MGQRDALLLCSPQDPEKVSFLGNRVCPPVVSQCGAASSDHEVQGGPAEGGSGERWVDLVLHDAADLI